MAKACFKCNERKPYSEFYQHSRMADGYLNKCKTCTKADANANRNARLEYCRAYDRKRGSRQSSDYLQQYRAENPKKYTAHNAVNNAVRDGKLFQQSCEICGDTDTHGHHDDYDKPLSVRWLCAMHHKQWHEENGEGANAH